MSRDDRIALRRIKLSVDAVEFVAELILLCHKNAVETVCVPRVEYLPRIARTYRCYAVGSLDSALHHIDVAVIFEDIRVIHRYTHDLIEYLLAVFALILDVMDSIDVLYAVIALLILIVNVVVNRYECGLLDV